jgi:HD superfamily phosphohydrolase
VDRLLHSLTLVPAAAGRTVGLHEKGVSALESRLFAKYQMYRNVYWHHAVRSATAMFKRVVRSALARAELAPAWIAHTSDEALMERLRTLPDAALAERLRRRHLFKRVLDLPAAELPPGAGAWVAEHPDLTARVEDRLAAECGRRPGDVLLDFPAKPEMLTGDVPVLTRHGTVAPARLGIQQVADELHTGARRFRLYAGEPLTLRTQELLALLEGTAGDVEDRLVQEHALLG